jgi:preprotein translocase subunit Sec61beta
MPKSSKKSEGFHSAAGLIRYFEAEEDVALKVNPWVVVGLCVGLSALVLIMTVVFPT